MLNQNTETAPQRRVAGSGAFMRFESLKLRGIAYETFFPPAGHGEQSGSKIGAR
jgi:hypothetical protein